MPEQTVEQKTPNVEQTSGAHGVLVMIGCVLVILFAAGAVANHFGGSETTEVTTPAKAATTEAGAAAGGEEAKATEKTTTSTAWPSDTLLTTLLGAGAALIIVGFLYSRISAITLPGGAKIELTKAEKEKAVEETLKSLPDDATDEQKAAAVTTTLSELDQQKNGSLELPREQIAHTARMVAAQR